MGDSQIKEFCACTMSKAADLISLEEVNLMRQKKIQSVIGPAVAKGGQYCIKLLSEKWGYSTKDQGVHQNHAQQYPPTSSEKKELSSSLKKEIYDSSMWNCLKKQKADIENSIVPEEDIKEYCSCISKKYITIVTYDDITYMLKNKTYPSKLVKYIRQIGFDCASDIVKK
jgi:hypothetical protein